MQPVKPVKTERCTQPDGQFLSDTITYSHKQESIERR
jgi:hypothetical protein